MRRGNHRCGIAVLGVALLLAADLAARGENSAEENLNGVWHAAQALIASRTRDSSAGLAPCESLATLLPAGFGRYARERISHEQTASGGLPISLAEGEYAADGARVFLRISDFGNSGAASVLGAAWALAPFERQTTSGYERTCAVRDWPALEEYDRDARFGRLQVLVRERFIIDVWVRDGSPEELFEAAEAVQWEGLSGL